MAGRVTSTEGIEVPTGCIVDCSHLASASGTFQLLSSRIPVDSLNPIPLVGIRRASLRLYVHWSGKVLF